jgi:hypothetical protein
MENNILLMILPPHTSHLTQPLDVGVFGALKKQMAVEIEPLVRTGIARIQKVEWLTAFVIAHDKAVSAKNILSGFRGTGIHPFLPTKVLRRVASPSPEPPSRPSTPPNPLAPFNQAVLTDSPVDFNAVQRANVALNTLLESQKPLPTSARIFVCHLARSVMRLHTRNTILEQQNSEQKAVLQGRKRPLSGKRRAIDGKHLMTGAELIGVREAEEVTKQRKAPKKGIRKRNARAKVKKESSDESEADSYLTDDGDVEILDCIEVECSP